MEHPFDYMKRKLGYSKAVAKNLKRNIQRFAKVMCKHEAKIAISRFGVISNDNIRIIDEIKPDFIKLDMREIDTLNYNEEQETMEDIVAKAKEHQSVLTAENIESPAQLARVWQYGIKIVQGKGNCASVRGYRL